MEGEEGFMGVTGREWCVYQVNTAWVMELALYFLFFFWLMPAWLGLLALRSP